MFINPFVSVDIHLENDGWIKQYEGEKGFTYAKKIGVSVFYVAKYREGGIRFFDGVGFGVYDAIPIDEKELMLFAKKIREWKGHYENKNSN